jgi:hypothetical protein
MYFYTLEIMWCFFMCREGVLPFIIIGLKARVRFGGGHKV